MARVNHTRPVLAPVIPVLTVQGPADGVPLARALARGGLRALEVTLRTPAALDVIREMTRVEGAVVGEANTRNLNTLVQVDPIWVQFSPSSKEWPHFQELMAKGTVSVEIATDGDMPAKLASAMPPNCSAEISDCPRCRFVCSTCRARPSSLIDADSGRMSQRQIP